MECHYDDDEETRHYNEVVASMRHYYLFFRKAIVVRMTKHFGRLSGAHVARLPGGAAGVKAKVKAYDDALRTNQRFFDRVLVHMGEAPSALTTDFDPHAVKSDQRASASAAASHRAAESLIFILESCKPAALLYNLASL